MAVKAITNLLDKGESSQQQFTENFSVAAKCLGAELQRIIEAMRGKSLDELAG